MRAGPTGWRLSNGGVPIPPLPDAVARAPYFTAEVEIVRSSLTDEQLALPQYAADNHAAWTAYFERRQQQRLASTNGAPVVGSTKNSEGRHLWWGVPGRTLEGVLTHLEGSNNPPLAYPSLARAAAPAHRRRAGQWMPRRFGSSSSSSSQSSSHSSGSPALLGVKAEPAAETPLGRRTRSAGIVINEGGRRASSSAPPCFVKPKTEPGLAPVKTEPVLPAVKTEHGDVELDDDAALEWARKDFLKMARERQCAALRRFEQCRRGRDEGVVVVIEDSDNDNAPPPPVRHGDAGQGSTRDGRVKEEKADDDDGGEDGGDDYSRF
ncbi:hypothetical protein CFC21_013454 [Triticum aestivum]|uniref:Uncharacterized protein n=2 Tax=Triticum aestivum TaxID=4565 RepID=A0A9R1DSD0_WHEAT|nr:hypothetical protein CFC21_013454 [Triticum aestivum]